MQVIANQKGAVQKRIRCHLANSSEQRVTLKDKFLSKSENYVLTVENFYTNGLPGLFLDTDVAMQIRLKAPAGTVFPHPYPANDPLEPYSRFEIGPRIPAGLSHSPFSDKSVVGLTDRLRVFIDTFNFNVFIHGADYFPLNNNNQEIDPADPTQRHDLHSYTDPNTVIEHQYISLGITAQGRLQIKMSQKFLSNFYLEFSPKFSKLTGLDRYVWADEILGALVRSNTATALDIVAGGNFGLLQMDIPDTTGEIWQATKSVYMLDERISIDVESTVPVFNSMTSEFSVEKQEHLLSRFVLPDYTELSSNMVSQNGLLLTDVGFKSQSENILDLVRNPYCKVNAMRSGQIQALNLSLWVRYLVGDTLQKVRFALGQTEWVDMGLLFTKKV